MNSIYVRELLIRVDAGPEGGPDHTERATRRLRAELSGLDVEVRAAPGAAPPPGAKGIAEWSAVVVALSSSGGVLATVLGTIRDWLKRQPGGHRVSITLDGETIEVESATADEQSGLVAAFVARHARS